ncbi:MAG TPA: glycosyl hydrolase family 65 protein [Nocardioidaceae bacterium]|nr:glycosyl hydrolase family 65 protein [Nocardioidaceae bacterium]
MRARHVLAVEPWCVRETELDLDHLGRIESLFALSNGHIGLRANLDEGEPNEIPGTYLGSFFEQRPLPYAEPGYGYPEVGQSIVNVTNGKLIRLLVDDSPFDIRYGDLLAHERTLDLRAGVLRREVDWRSPAGVRVLVRSTRLVSFAQRAVAAIAYEVEATEPDTRVLLQSQLVANEAPPAQPTDDPRVAAALERPLVAVYQELSDLGALLMHRTRSSGLLIAAAMDHRVSAPGDYSLENDCREDRAGTSVVATLQPGQTLRLVKFLGYGWSGHRSEPAVRDQVAGALTGARAAGWQGLVDEQRAYLDRFWRGADVEVQGDPAVQQAVRFALFHVLQASARTERRAIAAKGLTGPGYDGHAFWDTEAFVLPMLTLLTPHATADALRWRASTLPQAVARAETLGLSGATFPWRTINGAESAAYWPAGTAAFHVNADVAAAFEDYRIVTGDVELERECGLEVLVQTARLWHSLGHRDRHGAWHLDGVTGPDEYTAVVDDNVFTNLMAARNLTAAAQACARHPRLAERLGVGTEEMSSWEDCAEAVHIPYDDELGVHPQSETFTRHDEWDFEASDGRYPLMLHAPYVQLYRRQVVKQADLVLAIQRCGDMFTPEEKARDFDYYERRTVRDSSLSAATQAVVAAEVGHLQLAHDYLRESALMDLHDLHHNTRGGVHLAALAGAWAALVEGFGGLRRHGGGLCLAPALPDRLTRLTFRVGWHGAQLLVEVSPEAVRCSLPGQPDSALDVSLYDEPVRVTGERPVERALRPRKALLPEPAQPPGREPMSGLDLPEHVGTGPAASAFR